LPGQYTVRLTANGQTYTAPLVVKMDPRVKTPPADLQRQFEMETLLASLLTRSSQGVLQGKSLRDQLNKLHKPASGPAADAIKDFEQKLTAVLGSSATPKPGAEPQPSLTRLASQTSTVYGLAGQADVAPTQALLNAALRVQGEFAAVIRRWEELKSTDLPALNRQLSAAGLPALQVEEHPKISQDEGEEE
jgi:hypothetical protein